MSTIVPALHSSCTNLLLSFVELHIQYNNILSWSFGSCQCALNYDTTTPLYTYVGEHVALTLIVFVDKDGCPTIK